MKGLLVLLLAVPSAPPAPLPSTEEPAVPRQPELTRPFSDRQPLVVGVTPDSFPYSYMDEDGRRTGFSADLLDAVARVMGLRLARVPDEGQSLLRRFRDGEFDLLQALSQTPERGAYAEFSVPYLTLQGALFVRASDRTLVGPGDLQGKRIAIVGRGSIGDQFLRDHAPRAEPVYVGSRQQALRLLEHGSVAATFGSQLTTLSIMQEHGIRDVRMLGRPYAEYDVRHCFAVHRGDATLLARLNEGLAILHRSGEFQRIYDHWFGRLGSPMISREQVISYGALLLSVGFVAALVALLRQRALGRRIARQAAQLTRQQALLQALYDNVPFAMCVLEAGEGGERVLSLNRRAEALLALTPAQAIGHRLSELPLDREWADGLTSLLARDRTGSALVREERTLESLRKRVLSTVLPLETEPGGKALLCVLVEDVTERRQLDLEVARSRTLRAMGELVGGIAHEFNNLLTPILVKVGLIQLDWSEDRRLGRELAVIATAGQRAAELTRRLLSFGRRSEARAESVHLQQVVDNCVGLLRLTVDRRIEWQLAVPPALPPVHLNATDLNQILLNLLLNARDTLVEKLAVADAGWTPTIRVEVEQLAAAPTARPVSGEAEATPALGWQRLTVRDNGMGMRSVVRERIFEPLFTTKEVGRGTGLGLATVWHLLSGLGGQVDVESTPGEGTAFHLLLPVTATPDGGLVQPTAPARSPTAGARIFLAEDDALVLEAVASGLSRAGHAVTSASDGLTAWNLVQDRLGEYDVLVLDVNMPGLSGIDLARRVRASRSFSGSTIIIGGRLTSDQLHALADARVDAVLRKPFELAELQAAVARCLAAAEPPAR